MVTREFLIQILSGPMRSATRGRATRLGLTIAATLCCWGVLAVENGAEQVDSGWAVATPPPIASGLKPADPKQQIILHHVFQQAQVPLLQSPSSSQTAADLSASQESSTTGQGSLRFAVRPDGVEGWRPAGQIIAPTHEPWRMQVTVPQLNAPVNAKSAAGVAGVEAGTRPPVLPGAGSPARDAGDAILFSPGLENTSDQRTEPASPDAAPPAESFEALLGEASSKPAADPSVQQPIKAESAGNDDDDIGPVSDDSLSDSSPKPSAPPPLTKQLIALRSKVRGVLKGYYRKQLNSREHDPWEVMHGMLAYGVHSRIRQGGSRGEPVTSVGWLCYNKPCKGLTLMYVTPKGELRAKYGVGLQGHLGQLLAMLAQCRVSEDYPIHVGTREFTIKDLIEAEKKTCYPKSELTFKLIALQYYLDLDDKWVNDQGVPWDIPRLIREELAQPIRGAACGGTHRLSSLSLTVKTRVRRGEPLDGEYARAAEFVKKYHQYAFRLQNRDGSLSTSWFRGGGDDSDINRRIKTTGHILEWLCYSLSDEELRDPKTVAAVSYLANLMYSKYDNEWEVGPRCHATHALLVYDERVFQPFDGAGYEVTYKPKLKAAIAKRPQPKTLRR